MILKGFLIGAAWAYTLVIAFPNLTPHYNVGVAEGEARAINPRDPSERLEMACLGMWVGKQNKKWHEKEQ
jgi:hypothetical protein